MNFLWKVETITAISWQDLTLQIVQCHSPKHVSTCLYISLKSSRPKPQRSVRERKMCDTLVCKTGAFISVQAKSPLNAICFHMDIDFLSHETPAGTGQALHEHQHL